MPSNLFEEIRAAEPESARVAEIRRTLSRSLKPVLPLPSNRVLTALLVGAFVALAVAGALPVGFERLRILSFSQCFFYYSLLLLSASVLAAAVVQEMIPGTQRRIPLAVTILVPPVAIALLVLVLFPDIETRHFVERGIPCLRLGLLCAIPGGALIGIGVRRGFVTDWIVCAITVGALAGLIGVASLALHCSIENAAHILVWHLGVMFVAAATGAVAGWFVSQR